MKNKAISRRFCLIGAITAATIINLGCATNAQTVAGISATIACTLAAANAQPGKAAEECAKYAVVGAAVGYWIGLQMDAQEAKLAAQRIKNSGGNDVDVSVRTRMVAVPPDARGGALANTQAVEVLDEFVVSVPTSKLESGEVTTFKQLADAGGVVSKANRPYQVFVSTKTMPIAQSAVSAMQNGYTVPVQVGKVQYTYVEETRSPKTTVRIIPSPLQAS
jgi:hypothetical protein